ERLECDHHPLLDRLRMVERDQAAEDWLLPDREPDAVPVLERERRLLVREAELLGTWPELDDLGRRHARSHPVDRDVEVVAAAPVRIYLSGRRAADRERPVVARPVAVEAVDDVEVRRVAGAQHAVGKRVRMRAAALA